MGTVTFGGKRQPKMVTLHGGAREIIDLISLRAQAEASEPDCRLEARTWADALLLVVLVHKAWRINNRD